MPSGTLPTDRPSDSGAVNSKHPNGADVTLGDGVGRVGGMGGVGEVGGMGGMGGVDGVGASDWSNHQEQQPFDEVPIRGMSEQQRETAVERGMVHGIPGGEAVHHADMEGEPSQVGWLRTRTRPSLNLLLLLRASARAYNGKVRHAPT